MTGVYLAGVGFRPAGVRLARPVEVVVDGRTLTITDLVATPEGTELIYELGGLSGDEGYTARQDVVAIDSGGLSQVLERGAFSFTTDHAFKSTGPLRRRIHSTSAIPLRAGAIGLAITVEGLGPFRLAAELRPFGRETDAPYLDANGSVTHEGITVTVHRVGAARAETAVEIEVTVGDGACCVGIGGYQGSRSGPTALSLRDERGRAYGERWQPPGRLDSSTLALFEPLHPDVREGELEVPYVFIEESAATPVIELPVMDPVDMQVGAYGIRVLATAHVEGNPTARNAAYWGPALGVDLDLGGWRGDRRVLLPGRIVLDGNDCNIGYRWNYLNASRPEPVDHVEITGERIAGARTLGFLRPSIQVRGPWRVRFPIART